MKKNLTLMYNYARLIRRYVSVRECGILPFSERVLVLSYPRSGSSWVGEVLGQSPGCTYLREPVTQPYLRRYGGKQVIFDPLKDMVTRKTYEMLTKLALNDLTFDLEAQVRVGAHMAADVNSPVSLIIKEVNPRAAQFFANQGFDTMIFLMRHPAAVAYSFYKLGWLGCKDTQLAPPSAPNVNEWRGFGYAYGTYVKEALVHIRNHQHGKIVFYEEFATQPHERFSEIYEYSGLAKPPNYANLMDAYCFGQKSDNSGHETERDSLYTSEKWIKNMSLKEMREVREGYMLSEPEFYWTDSAWPY